MPSLKGPSDTTYSAPPEKVLPEYVALGDSLAVGATASDPATKGYVPLFRDFLESESGLDTDLFLNNLGHGGDTSTTLITHGHLAAAVAELAARNGDGNPNNNVEVVTVDIGGNDVLALVPICAEGLTPDCVTAIGTTFATFSANFDLILDELRTAAGPDTTIIVMTYYNPLPGCFLAPFADLGDTVLEGLPGLEPFGLGPSDGLNDRIRSVAATHGAEVADTFGKLPPDDLVGGFDCLHPVDSGYAEIAEQFIEAFNG